MTGTRKSDPIEKRRLTLLRQADSSRSSHSIGGIKKSDARKPSLPKMPWDDSCQKCDGSGWKELSPWRKSTLLRCECNPEPKGGK
jgi:hypothetical protein